MIDFKDYSVEDLENFVKDAKEAIKEKKSNLRKKREKYAKKNLKENDKVVVLYKGTEFVGIVEKFSDSGKTFKVKFSNDEVNGLYAGYEVSRKFSDVVTIL